MGWRSAHEPRHLEAITTVSLTDREIRNCSVSFSASRWNNNNASGVPLTAGGVQEVLAFATQDGASRPRTVDDAPAAHQLEQQQQAEAETFVHQMEQALKLSGCRSAARCCARCCAC